VRTTSDRGLWWPDPERLGAWRAIEPGGVPLHAAHRVDARSPANEFEAEIDVELVCVDSTSYAELRRRSGDDPAQIAALIGRIVAEHGKLQNPWTGSGGVLAGRLSRAGARYDASPAHVGELVVPLASLIAVPLELEHVGPVSVTTTHVPVRGRAIVTGAMQLATVGDELELDVAISVLDVFPAASYACSLARPGGHVLVLGAGHAGLLALVAAREAVGADGRVTAVDIAADALERARRLDPAVAAIKADVSEALTVAGSLAAAGLARPDLTLVCTTVAGAEAAALLASAPDGRIVFFSTATSFAAAALGADAVGCAAQLIIPNGLTEDRGSYALGLVRRNGLLREFLS